ncbi:MAG: hypothetical protein AAF288_06505 [Planctomycetota bacterium]
MNQPTPRPSDRDPSANADATHASTRTGLAVLVYLGLALGGVSALWSTGGSSPQGATSPTTASASVATTGLIQSSAAPGDVAVQAKQVARLTRQAPTPAFPAGASAITHTNPMANAALGAVPGENPAVGANQSAALPRSSQSTTPQTPADAPQLRPLRVTDLVEDAGEAGPFGLALHEGDLRIVYVVDASGSLVDRFPFVLAELATSIETLGAHRSFAVVFFRDGQPVELDDLGLRSATGSAKRAAATRLQPDALNLAPTGRTDPRAAVRRAMAYHPDRVFLISDNLLGAAAEPRRRGELLADFDFANGHAARISTVQLLDHDPLERFGFQPLLQAIAQRHNGEYRVVSSDDLGLEPVVGVASGAPDWLLP